MAVPLHEEAVGNAHPRLARRLRRLIGAGLLQHRHPAHLLGRHLVAVGVVLAVDAGNNAFGRRPHERVFAQIPDSRKVALRVFIYRSGEDEVAAESGFTLEPFGDRSYLVRAVPALVGKGDWPDVLREVLDGAEGRTDWSERAAISLACHGAVRAGQSLTYEEIRELVRSLEALGLPKTCPHGRPILLHLSSNYYKRHGLRQTVLKSLDYLRKSF